MAFKGGGGRPRTDLELSKYTSVTVKFTGGREVRGLLKGFDTLFNLVLENCVETLRDPNDPYKPTDKVRTLGTVVARGSQVMLISPVEGCEQIENPWAVAEQQKEQSI